MAAPRAPFGLRALPFSARRASPRQVDIDQEAGTIKVWNNGNGLPVEMHKDMGVYVPEMIFGNLLTSSNYNDSEKKVVGGRNGYGAKLANIFSTEFIVETADGSREKKYRQVFSNNMQDKSKPKITKCKASDNWTCITFTPDLSKFGMDSLDDDTVALMRKRVYDVAGCIGARGVKVRVRCGQVGLPDEAAHGLELELCAPWQAGMHGRLLVLLEDALLLGRVRSARRAVGEQDDDKEVGFIGIAREPRLRVAQHAVQRNGSHVELVRVPQAGIDLSPKGPTPLLLCTLRAPEALQLLVRVEVDSRTAHTSRRP